MFLSPPTRGSRQLISPQSFPGSLLNLVMIAKTHPTFVINHFQMVRLTILPISLAHLQLSASTHDGYFQSEIDNLRIHREFFVSSQPELLFLFAPVFVGDSSIQKDMELLLQN